MKANKSVLVILAAIMLAAAVLASFFLIRSPEAPKLVTAKAVRQELRAVISTNGVIEPLDRTDIYAPIDGFVASSPKRAGAEIQKGTLIMQLYSDQIRTSLAEANAALLAAKRQARVVETGPSKEELASLDASIAESALQLDQNNKDLAVEESLYEKRATSRSAVENLKKQRDLLQLHTDALKAKRAELLGRYSAEDKKWEQGRLSEIKKQVDTLEQQLRTESVVAPRAGIIYSLQAKQGAYVTRGQLLAQIYTPGGVRLRAYVDEPDLGRVRKGQQVRIEWDGLPDERWTGSVESPAEQVVALNNRSIGEILCSVESGEGRLIPNLNVRVEITTDLKRNAIVVPRSAIATSQGKPAVYLSLGERTEPRMVDIGLFTPDGVEILSGINEGDSVVLNPSQIQVN